MPIPETVAILRGAAWKGASGLLPNLTPEQLHHALSYPDSVASEITANLRAGGLITSARGGLTTRGQAAMFAVEKLLA